MEEPHGGYWSSVSRAPEFTIFPRPLHVLDSSWKSLHVLSTPLDTERASEKKHSVMAGL